MKTRYVVTHVLLIVATSMVFSGASLAQTGAPGSQGYLYTLNQGTDSQSKSHAIDIANPSTSKTYTSGQVDAGNILASGDQSAIFLIKSDPSAAVITAIQLDNLLENPSRPRTTLILPDEYIDDQASTTIPASEKDLAVALTHNISAGPENTGITTYVFVPSTSIGFPGSIDKIESGTPRADGFISGVVLPQQGFRRYALKLLSAGAPHLIIENRGTPGAPEEFPISSRVDTRIVGMALSPDGKHIYIPEHGNGAPAVIHVFDTQAKTFTRISLPAKTTPELPTLSRDGSALYVNSGDSFLSVNLATNVTTTVTPDAGPVRRVRMSPTGKDLHVLTENSLITYDAQTLAARTPAFPLSSPGLEFTYVGVPHALKFYLHGDNRLDMQRRGTPVPPILIGKKTYVSHQAPVGGFVGVPTFKIMAQGVGLTVGATYKVYSYSQFGSRTLLAEGTDLAGGLNGSFTLTTKTFPNGFPRLFGRSIELEVQGLLGVNLGGEVSLETSNFIGTP